MYCTVKPGKYCIFSPSQAAKLKPIQLRPMSGRDGKSFELPVAAKTTRRKNPRKPLAKNAQGRPFAKNVQGK